MRPIGRLIIVQVSALRRLAPGQLAPLPKIGEPPMDRSAVRAVWTIAPACALVFGLVAGVRADGSAAPAPPPDAVTNQELRQEIDLLKQRLAELERKLDQKPVAGSVQLQE